MCNFVRKGGERFRSDASAHEHLIGEQDGFYSTRIDLSKYHAPVPTPMSSGPGYRVVYAADIVLTSLQGTARRMGRTTGVVSELGPAKSGAVLS